MNGLLVSRWAAPTVVSRGARGREARGMGAAPGCTITPDDPRVRVDVSVGALGGGKPNDVSTGAAPGAPGAPVPGYGLFNGRQVAIGSVPARK